MTVFDHPSLSSTLPLPRKLLPWSFFSSSSACPRSLPCALCPHTPHIPYFKLRPLPPFSSPPFFHPPPPSPTPHPPNPTHISHPLALALALTFPHTTLHPSSFLPPPAPLVSYSISQICKSPHCTIQENHFAPILLNRHHPSVNRSRWRGPCETWHFWVGPGGGGSRIRRFAAIVKRGRYVKYLCIYIWERNGE